MSGSLRHLSRALMHMGEYGQATDVLQQSLMEQREAQAFGGVPQALNLLGEAALAGGDYSAAQAYFQESRTLCRELDNTWDAAGALLGMGHVGLATGDGGLAGASYAEALQRFTSLPDWDGRRRSAGVALCLDGLASAVAGTRLERAARLWGSAAAVRATVGRAALRTFEVAYPLPCSPTADDAALTAVHAQRDDATFAAAWAEGQAMTLEQAIAYALEP